MRKGNAKRIVKAILRWLGVKIQRGIRVKLYSAMVDFFQCCEQYTHDSSLQDYLVRNNFTATEAKEADETIADICLAMDWYEVECLIEEGEK